MPAWAGVNVDAFMAGFGIVEIAAATLFVGLLGFHMVKKLLAAAGV